MSAAACACGAMVDLTGDVPMAAMLEHQRTSWHIRRINRASTPTPEEVTVTDSNMARLDSSYADDLRARAAAYDRKASEDEQAANAIGFGSDRAAQWRREARMLRAQADAIEPVATPDSYMHVGSDPEAEAEYAACVEGLVEVRVYDVPRLVRAGAEVWAMGYGWESDMDGFTTLSDDDLWAFVGPDRDADTVSSWGPFHVDPAAL